VQKEDECHKNGKRTRRYQAMWITRLCQKVRSETEPCECRVVMKVIAVVVDQEQVGKIKDSRLDKIWRCNLIYSTRTFGFITEFFNHVLSVA
jgi:hypothetical protein